jgi:hypothetical protein
MVLSPNTQLSFRCGGKPSQRRETKNDLFRVKEALSFHLKPQFSISNAAFREPGFENRKRWVIRLFYPYYTM